MSSNDSQQPIVVKRIKKNAAGAHGGAWKLAYADFMTAMMAFFLLMWLLGSTSKGDLKGIADFFQNPLKLSMEGGPSSGSSLSPISSASELTKVVGEIAKGKNSDIKKSDCLKRGVCNETGGEAGSPKNSEAERQEKIEREILQDIKSKIEAVIEANPDIRIFKRQLLIDITSEGLRIQIVDEKNRPMFDSASAEMKSYTKIIVRAIARVINQVENKVSISGHTDAAQFAGGDKGFSNWELSANRANSCRRELVLGGIEERKITRVVGLASSIALDRSDPFNPINRRIAIVLMNKKTERAILQEGREIDLSVSAEVVN